MLCVTVIALCLLHTSQASALKSTAALKSAIYLAPRGSNLWQGDCAQTATCTRNQPCLPASSIQVSGDCSVVFTQGDYASNAQVVIGVKSFGSYDLLIDGTVENLRLRDQTGAFSISSTPERLATLMDAQIELEFPKDAFNKIERVIFVDSTIKVVPASLEKFKSSWQISTSQIRYNRATAAKTFLSLLTEASSTAALTNHYFEFSNINVDLQTANFIAANVYIPLANHRNSMINGVSSLYVFSGRATPGTLQFFDTEVTNVYKYLIKSELTPTATADVTTSGVFSTSDVPPAFITLEHSEIRGVIVPVSQEIPRISNYGPNILAKNSNFSYISVNCAKGTWHEPGQGALNTALQWYTNVSLHNCAACYSSAPTFNNVFFSYQSEDKSYIFAYLKDVTATFNKVNFTLDSYPSMEAFSIDRLIIDGDVVLNEGSSVYTNTSVYLKANARAAFRQYRLSGTVSMENGSRFVGTSNWTLVYPVKFRAVGPGTNGAAAASTVDWTNIGLLTFVPGLTYVHAPAGVATPQLFASDATVTVSMKNDVLFAKTHIFWDANALGTPRAVYNYDIGNFNLNAGSPATFTKNCTSVLGDWFRFAGTATQVDTAKMQYRATYTYEGWATLDSAQLASARRLFH